MEPYDTVRANNARPSSLLAGAGEARDAASKIVLVSGGFDPLHIGHLRLIRGASRYGRVYVALNSDAWLMRKKGYTFMPWVERAEILWSISLVARVLAFNDNDDTACEAIRDVQPHYFANGGDRVEPNPYEETVCNKLGVIQLFGVGGNKVQSSSSLVDKAKK